MILILTDVWVKHNDGSGFFVIPFPLFITCFSIGCPFSKYFG